MNTSSGGVTTMLLLLILIGQKTIAENIIGDVVETVQRKFVIFLKEILSVKSNTALHKAVLKNRGKAARKVHHLTPFPCDLASVMPRSEQVPNNVNMVRPGDIDVIGALGDSLSAGTGISATRAAEELFIAQRGRAFSGGGEGTWRSHLTLPNIIKVFNPNVIGFASRATHITEWESQFNVAENGAVSSQAYFMAEELVKRITWDARIDVQKDWKMITLMIGDNDFCSKICTNENFNEILEEHRQDLLRVLTYLKFYLPRTIVNVIPPPRLDLFFEMKNMPLSCFFIHNVVCPCINNIKYKKQQNNFSELMKTWQSIDYEVSFLPEFQSDDFAVITQPFTLNYTFPRTIAGDFDLGFLAPDCFHFSEKGQAQFANDLWNSLLEPVGNKSLDGRRVFQTFNCPTAQHPYIFTLANS